MGAELVKKLVSANGFVFVADKAEKKDLFGEEELKSIGWFINDLSDIGLVANFLEENKIQTVFHLAGQPSVPGSQNNPLGAFETNARLVWLFLEACRKYGKLSEIICVSSNHIYGEQAIMPTKEDAALGGLGVYAASKACGDIIARCYAKNYDLPIGIGRITNTFGGNDPHSEHIITASINLALSGKNPVIKRSGRDTKGFLFFEDTLNGLILLAEKIKLLNLCGEGFNFAPDKPVSVLSLVETIIKISGKIGIQPVIMAEKDDFEEEFLCNEKAKKILGWNIEYPLETGIEKTIQNIVHE